MAGRLYPPDGPRSKVSHGECAVYRALAAGGLPEGWTAWHSLRLRAGNGWEGEGDFVIASPKRGLLVLEVKGDRQLECSLQITPQVYGTPEPGREPGGFRLSVSPRPGAGSR